MPRLSMYLYFPMTRVGIDGLNFLCYSKTKEVIAVNNEEKILELLISMDQRLNGLEQGQARLEQGQIKLEQRQINLEQRQINLEQRQIKLEQGQAKLQEDIEIIKEDLAATKVTVDAIGDWAERMEATHNIGLYN